MALGLFLFVVAAGGVSVGIFYVQGSEAAVIAQVAVIPLLVVAGYLWVNRTIQSTGTSRTEFERRKARQVGEQFRDAWQLAQEIEFEYEYGITTAEWDRLNRHVDDLQSNGISFDPNTASFDVDDRDIGSLEDINRLESETADLEDWLVERFADNVRDRISAVNAAVDRLDPIIGETTTIDPSSVPDVQEDESTTWQEIGTQLDECYQKADQAVEDACTAIQDAATSADQTNSDLEPILSQSRDAAKQRRYDQAATSVLEAKDRTERDVSAVFDEQREELLALLQTASEKPIEQYLGPNHQQELQSYQDELQALDDAIEISRLRSLKQECRSGCLEIIKELSAHVSDALETLEQSDVPDGWYEHPPAARTNFVRNLQACEDIESFHDEFDTAVDSLLSALDTVDSKASVVNGYLRVEPDIQDQLRAEGVVTGSDIPVSEHEEQFLGLYYRNHMDQVTFDPNEPRLSTQEGAETYTLTVTAMFPEGGTERDVEIELLGREEHSEHCRTPLVAEATFESLPYGEYTVRIEPADAEFSTVERTITLDSAKTVDADIEEISLREQLCDGLDVDADSILSNLSTRFDSEFEEAGYLSTAMEFPVDSEYIPCLLTIWAEQEGYAATQYDGDVIVYDRQRVTKEIENVIQYNLSVGDTRQFEEIRSNFLSAPVPDSIITDLIENSFEEAAVVLDGTQLTKEEET